MIKGQKYQKKINASTLRLLRKQGKTNSQIAKHFNCSIEAVNKAVKRYSLQKHGNKKKYAKIAKTKAQKKIFAEAEKYAITAQTMIDELSLAVSENIIIKDLLKKEIDDIKDRKSRNIELERLQRAQDKLVQRMTDFRDLQKDLTGIVELQKFIAAVIDAYKVLPLEYRVKFQNELKKRDIIHLGIEQLVTGRNDSGGDGDLSRRTKAIQPSLNS